MEGRQMCARHWADECREDEQRTRGLTLLVKWLRTKKSPIAQTADHDANSDEKRLKPVRSGDNSYARSRAHAICHAHARLSCPLIDAQSYDISSMLGDQTANGSEYLPKGYSTERLTRVAACGNSGCALRPEALHARVLSSQAARTLGKSTIVHARDLLDIAFLDFDFTVHEKQRDVYVIVCTREISEEWCC
ncbi:hypothetical protein WOLCODRAFT_152044 [Wolfiporia cocos MD-104 SS10]|uniref:Uncharacterized protein n=1 Tax=Wolfiporia cocos (strain MD-104) TaxID=742152 RepID=A0A2H3JSY5_WOLCO|nr:hypothetical protein WOLCODRAFT_152044 [Wolfiporia cocos MD-104 SS10]